MERPYVYDADLAPGDHFKEVIQRARCSPLDPNARLQTGEFRMGTWLTYPHCPWPRHPAIWEAASSSSCLDTPELKSHDAQPTSLWGASQQTPDHAVTFRHSGWARSRALVRQALLDLDTPARSLHRFDTCGSDPWVVVDQNDSSRLAIHSNHCHSRWCTPCSRERAHRIVGNLQPTLSQGDIRFLTLTMKHSPAPLSGQIDRIYASFRKLRRAPFWTRAVDGGCAVLELVHSHRTGCWHVHLHCLLHGTWIDVKALKAEWWRITRDSYVIDIRPCTDSDHAAHYITKYVTKPVPSSVINKPDQLREMIAAYAHRRLVLTWGTWRGIRLTEPLDATVWKSIASLPQLYQRRDAGNLDAYLILAHLEKMLPEARILAGRDPPPRESDPIGLLF